ncbi:MAG: uncharacterized protein JWP97_4238 [Labilithrix sp.]|nr:uncharacterized protein [Labilithrix sp.]
MRTGYLIAASLAFHVGLFATISQRSKQIEKRQTLIAMVDQKKKEAERKAEPPPKPIEAPKEVLRPKLLQPAPAPAPAEPAASPAPSPQMAAMPDYGLKLSGAKGSGGVGVPDNKGGVPGGTGTVPGGTGKPVEKTLGNPAPGAAKDPDLQELIAGWRPRATARVKPVYPDDARSSEIEGTVVVEAIIDCSGKVSSAKVLNGLGHGLDEAALTAVRKQEFERADGCRAGFQKSMKINYAFRLGD